MRPLSIVVVGTDFVCVAKDLSTDRLILDARPANLLQDPPHKYILSMASSQSLSGLFLEEYQKLLMTADDPSIFFYTCTVSEQRATKTFHLFLASYLASLTFMLACALWRWEMGLRVSLPKLAIQHWVYSVGR